MDKKNGYKFTIDQYNEAKKHLESYSRNHCFTMDLSIVPRMDVEDDKTVDVRKELE